MCQTTHGYVELVPIATALLTPEVAAEPEKAASPKLKTPPSAATSQ